MPKIASYSYPAITLTDAIQITDRVAKEFGGEISVSGLAKTLNMAEKGGGFVDKVAGLRDYGLVDGRGMMKLTPLGERVAFPHTVEEADRARAEAFLRVELFQRLFHRTSGRVPDEDSFAIFLADVAGANRVDVAKRASQIRRLFADGIQYARAARETPVADEDLGQPGLTAGAVGVARLSAPDTIAFYSGEIELRLPRTADSIDIIKGVLDMLKKQIQGEAEVEKA